MTAPNRQQIRAWLVDKLREELDGDDTLELDRPLAELGLESRVAVGITGELEDWLDIELDPTIFFDNPTIEALATFLADETIAQHDVDEG